VIEQEIKGMQMHRLLLTAVNTSIAQ